jgi:hypothetical protein
MSQQLRDVLHLVVDKLPFASEAERDSYHDLVNEAVPADEKKAEVEVEEEDRAEPVATAAAPSVTTSTTTAATPPTVV